MSHQTPLSGGTLVRPALTRLLSVGFALCSFAELNALEVDSELLLLVDVTIPGLTNVQFEDMMDAYASAFSSSQVMDTIQSGSRGQIALSLMFYGSGGAQEVGVPWMSIGSSSDADVFANLVSNVSRPTSFGLSNPASALATATEHFGTETGGTSNGYESSVQIIEIAASGLISPFGADETSGASDAAFAAGVDLVNSTNFGFLGGFSGEYYETNVIGSTIPGVEATSSTLTPGGDVEVVIADSVIGSIQTGANVTIEAVPEPSVPIMGAAALGLLAGRRRRIAS